jgi:hypothetical protein
MPLDTNIALGIRPVEQPNMLAQMGQMMQLRQAQQEYESQNALRDAFSQGADINDPAAFKRIAAINPKLAMDLRGKDFEQQQKQTEVGLKRADYLGAAFSGLVKNPTLDNAYSIFDTAVQMGILPSQAAAAMRAKLDATGGDPKQIAALAQQGIDSAISAKDKMSDATSRANNAATVGATLAGVGVQRDRLNMDREKTEYDRRNPALQLATGDNGFYLYNSRDPNSAVPLGMRPQAPVAPPVTQPSAVNNLMMTTQPSVNSLMPIVPNQPGAPTVANAEALAAQPTLIRPSKPIRQPVAVIKDGVVTLVPPEQAVGMTPATPSAEKTLERAVIAKEGKKSVNGVLDTLYSEYNNLIKSGGITDTRLSAEENIAARTGASGLGQLAGSFTGSESQSFRDTIEQTRPLLLTAIMKATGLSATQLNSNVELQTYLKTATDPKSSIQANVKALNTLSTMFGLGEKFELPEIKGAAPKETKPSNAPPAGLAPDIAKLWQYMTPEDRKLWQK